MTDNRIYSLGDLVSEYCRLQSCYALLIYPTGDEIANIRAAAPYLPESLLLMPGPHIMVGAIPLTELFHRTPHASDDVYVQLFGPDGYMDENT